jgi:hypothetical protein
VTGAGASHTVRTPPRPDAAAQRPVESVARAQAAAATTPASPPGPVGKVVDRLLGGRDRHHDEVTTALAAAVADLAERLAALSDRVDRTNDRVHDGAVRADAAEAADAEQTEEAVRLAARVDVTAAEVDALRADLAGAHEQDRITGAIVSDAEARLVEDIAELRLQLDKLREEGEPA